jgi:agmatinase
MAKLSSLAALGAPQRHNRASGARAGSRDAFTMRAVTEPIGQVDALEIPRFAGVRTFARLPTLEQAGRADVAVLGAPFDGATTFRAGARFGPAAVREASLLLRPYNEPLDVSPFRSRQVVDAGDAGPNPVDVIAGHAAIEAAARALNDRGARVLGIGGDHSVALPLLRAAAARHGQLSLLQLDAHTDTWDAYFGAKVTHGTIFRRAVEEGLIDGGHSVQIGLRGSLYDAEDYADNRSLGFHTLLAREFDEAGVQGAIAFALEHLRAPVYVTVDIDVLDPAFAPGTGTPESGGLSSRELLAVLRGLAAGPEIAAADVVEVSPPYDSGGITAVAGANVAYELLCLLALAPTA